MPLRDMDREQMWMLPPRLDELLPLDHPARFVAEFVDALGRDGWSELGVEIGGDPLGAPAYHPRALLSVWLYGFMTGVRSCRKLEAACRDQISYLWLTGWQHPDHNFQHAHPVADLALPRLHPATPRAESPSRFLIPTAPAVTLHQSIATFDSPGKSRSVNPTGLSHLLLPVTLYITFGTGSDLGGFTLVNLKGV